MIFITVGTHEQAFNRLLEWMDELIDEKIIKDDVICQKGFSDYKPRNYQSYKLLSYEEMDKYLKEARIVITHGGPASFIAPLALGKIPIVVPRQKKYNEHINDHQYIFCSQLKNKFDGIIVNNTKEELRNSIINYNKVSKNIKNNIKSNNNAFCEELGRIVDSLL